MLLMLKWNTRKIQYLPHSVPLSTQRSCCLVRLLIKAPLKEENRLGCKIVWRNFQKDLTDYTVTDLLINDRQK